jgi:hypothetical protein
MEQGLSALPDIRWDLASELVRRPRAGLVPG